MYWFTLAKDEKKYSSLTAEYRALEKSMADGDFTDTAHFAALHARASSLKQQINRLRGGCMSAPTVLSPSPECRHRGQQP